MMRGQGSPFLEDLRDNHRELGEGPSRYLHQSTGSSPPLLVRCWWGVPTLRFQLTNPNLIESDLEAVGLLE